MAELKQLKNGGTQKEQRDMIFLIASVGWVATLVALKMDWLQSADAATFGVTFQNWWMVTGVTQLVYTYGESQRKKADAQMNK